MTRAGALAALVALAGCGAGRDLPPAPPDLINAPVSGGFEQIRAFGDTPLPDADRIVSLYAAQLAEGNLLSDGRFDILALSGGGAWGAFGAGALRGLSDAANRPEFEIVTGVSTGAILAPFAFLGEAEDPNIARFYTGSETSDVMRFNPLFILAGGAALADTAPLEEAISSQIDEDFVARIAAEHIRGRRLLIGTTNLDAQRPVIWNIGAIALRGGPEAAELIRRVMLASSAIPGVFPPVEFHVDSDSGERGEIHVDGGVTRGMFSLPPGVSLAALERKIPGGLGRISYHVIVNAAVEGQHEPSQAGVLSIVARSLLTLLKHQAIADLERIAAAARQDGAELRILRVPADFRDEPQAILDPVFMSRLYALGRVLAPNEDAWAREVSALTP